MAKMQIVVTIEYDDSLYDDDAFLQMENAIEDAASRPDMVQEVETETEFFS